MSVQVLVAAMHQTDHTLLEKMNIQSDVIVGNQCDHNSIQTFNWKGHQAIYLNFAERGVGLNRNNALMRANGEFCLFADDDMVYVDGYVEKVQKAFSKYPDADVIVFNLLESSSKTQRYVIQKDHKLSRLNYLRYGTARIAVKLKSIKENAIYFNQCFGGGTEHCHGEDALFLTACFNKKLKTYAVAEYIAELTEERPSTWMNNGFDEKYLKDQGVLLYAISRKWWRILCLQDAIRRHKSYHMSAWQAYKIMIKG